jgi:hypothetical protein
MIDINITIKISKEKIKHFLVVTSFVFIVSLILSKIYIQLMKCFPFCVSISHETSLFLYTSLVTWLLLDNITMGLDLADATRKLQRRDSKPLSPKKNGSVYFVPQPEIQQDFENLNIGTNDHHYDCETPFTSDTEKETVIRQKFIEKMSDHPLYAGVYRDMQEKILKLKRETGLPRYNFTTLDVIKLRLNPKMTVKRYASSYYW